MQFELLPPVPAVVLARDLQRIPLFKFASVDELFRISSLSRQIRHEADAIFQEMGKPVEYIQLLVEGKAASSDGSEKPSQEVGPPTLWGFQEVLEGVPARETVRAVESSICLALSAEDFRALLADNIELAQGFFRMLMDNRTHGDHVSLLRQAVRPEGTMSPARFPESLTPVDKVLLLQQIPIFSRATAEELFALGNVAREQTLAESDEIFSQGDTPSILVLIRGELSVDSSSNVGNGNHAATDVVRPGDVVGVKETLAGMPMRWKGTVRQSGQALQIGRDGLFALLADHFDLLQGLFSALLQSDRPRGEA